MAVKPPTLKRRSDFLRVASRGRKIAKPGLVLQVCQSDSGRELRVGFTVTKKVGNAVIRNRTRRRLRAALFDVAQKRSLSSVDLVLIGREATRSRRYEHLVADLESALDKAGVL